MTGNASKYALIGGKEVTLLESIPHDYWRSRKPMIAASESRLPR
jgi:hypothetical protein